jgi:transposase InsO family protein
MIMNAMTCCAHDCNANACVTPECYSIPKTIVSDRGSQFTAHFWEHLHKGLGTSLVRSIAYHPQTDRQTERVNAILEDMLRACVLSSRGSWESWVPLAEFTYNNSYQESIKMAPFEALYGRKCRTLLNWIEPRERRFTESILLMRLRKRSVLYNKT